MGRMMTVLFRVEGKIRLPPEDSRIPRSKNFPARFQAALLNRPDIPENAVVPVFRAGGRSTY